MEQLLLRHRVAENLFKPLPNAKFVSKATSAGLLHLLDFLPNIDFIVISDVSFFLTQKSDNTPFSIIYEALEEGISEIVLRTEQSNLYRRRVSFIIAMTPSDYTRFSQKMSRIFAMDAFLSRFIIFNFHLDEETKTKIATREVSFPTLYYPKKIITSVKELADYNTQLVKKAQFKEATRIARNLTYISWSFAEITGNIDQAKRFSEILVQMRSQSVPIAKAEQYVFQEVEQWTKT